MCPRDAQEALISGTGSVSGYRQFETGAAIQQRPRRTAVQDVPDSNPKAQLPAVGRRISIQVHAYRK